MKGKEYLRQSYRLDQRIHSDLEEVERLREMASSVSSPRYDIDRVMTSRNNDAPFVRCLDKIMDLEDKIHEVIDGVSDTDERMVLRYRYIHNLTWEQIGDELHADRTTVYRWHNNAINHVILPEKPIKI